MKNIRKIFNIRKLSLFFVVLVVAILAPLNRVSAVTINGLSYFVGSTTRYSTMPNVSSVTSAFDVRGRINNNSNYNLQTTYSNGGYTIDFEVDGTNYAVQKVSNGTTVTNKGVKMTIVAGGTEDVLDVHLNIVNPEGNGDHNIRVAMTADVQLGSNDKAAIYKKDHAGIVVTQDDATSTSDYGAKIYIDFAPNVDTLWLGSYRYRLQEKYSESDETSFTVADDLDTAVAWSWNEAIEDGGEKTVTTTYRLTEAQTTAVGFYDLGDELVAEQQVLVGGATELLELADDAEEGQLHVWCTDRQDSSTCHFGGETIIVQDEDINFYEAYIRDDNAFATINYYDTNEELKNSDEELKNHDITLPELADDKEGYFHVWCTDKTDTTTCKDGGETITITDNTDFYENYVKDDSAFATINYYDLNEELTANDEQLKNHDITLPELDNDREGYFHVWCTDKADETTCENGGATVTITDNTDFYEAYVKDDNHIAPEQEKDAKDDNSSAGEPVDGNTVVYTASVATEGYGESNGGAQTEVYVPLGDETSVAADSDILDGGLEEVPPMGVTKQENIHGIGFWEILRRIWPFIAIILFSFFFFIIIFFKRRKDDDEEDAEQSKGGLK